MRWKILLTAMVAVSLGGFAPAEAACAIVPILRESNVNQGLPHGAPGDPLVKGKQTVVRLHLSLPPVMPTCATSTASVTLTSAQLTMSVGSAVKSYIPTSSLTPSPTIKPFSAAPSADWPGDPKFVVPGTDLQPAALTSFAATFTATISYQSKASATASPEPGATSFGATPPLISGQFQAGNPLRLLMYPMGDVAKTTFATWSTATSGKVLSGLQALSRIAPVADGVGPLGAGSAGLKYQINQSLLDLGNGPNGLRLLNAQGQFCGNEAAFDAIKPRLLSALQAWNNANPSLSADRIIGVVDESISPLTCYQGYAGILQPIAWARATSDKTGAPSNTGALFAMELAHTFGLQPPGRSNPIDLYHSQFTQADGGTERAYNIFTYAYASDDRTALRIFSPWHNNNVLYEQADWASIFCSLGGPASGGCAPNSVVGVAQGAGAGSIFLATGKTRLTSPYTTTVDRAYTDNDVARTLEDPTSLYRYVERNTATNAVVGPKSGRGYTLGPDTSGHASAEDGSHSSTHPSGSFSFVFPHAGGNRWELWRFTTPTQKPGETGTALLAAGTENAPPQIRSVEVSPVQQSLANLSNDAGADDVAPAVSPETGKFVAYAVARTCADGRAGGTILVRRADGTGGSATLPSDTAGQPASCQVPAPRFPAFRPDDGALSFARAGDLWTIKFDPETMTFTDPRRFYSCFRQAGACITTPTDTPLTGAASRTSWSRAPVVTETEHRLAFEVDGGDIFEVRPFGPDVAIAGVNVFNAKEIATDPVVFEGEPTYSPGTGYPAGTGELIAFRKGAADIYSANPLAADANITHLRLFTGGRTPSWGIRHIATEKNGAVFTTDLADPLPTPKQMTSGGLDLQPALFGSFGGFMALSRTFGAGTPSEQDEVVITRYSPGRRAMTVRGFDPDDLDATQADMYAGCATGNYVVAAGVLPVIEDGVATYTTEFDTDLTCGEAVAFASIFDRFSRTKLFQGGSLESEKKGPVVKIHTPLRFARLPVGEVLPVVVSGNDAEDGELTGASLSVSVDGKPAGTGNHVELPATLGPGAHTITATAIDSDGNYDTAGVVVTLITIGTARFDPKTLYVPSSGNPVNIYAEFANVNTVAPGSVRVMSIGGHDVSTNDDFKCVWKLQSGGTVGLAQCNRLNVTSFLANKGLVNQKVLIVIGGTYVGGSWAAGDSDGPLVKPAN